MQKDGSEINKIHFEWFTMFRLSEPPYRSKIEFLKFMFLFANRFPDSFWLSNFTQFRNSFLVLNFNMKKH